MSCHPIESLSTSESWRLFRIMAELVEGIREMEKAGPCVSIFGSARTKPDNPIYLETEQIAKNLVKAGYGVITGGGPGIMEAGNKGAMEADGTSVGLHIKLPHEEKANKYINLYSEYNYFFVRKLMFVKYAKAYVAMPGGMGTLDELSEAFVLMQTKRIEPAPIILYNEEFWGGMLDWLKKTMIGDGYLDTEELESFLYICNSPDEILPCIRAHYDGNACAP